MLLNRKTRKANRHRILVRLLVPNIVLIFLPLLIGWVIYNKTLVVMEKEVMANNMNILEQGKNTLDLRLEEVELIVRQLANDTRIIRFQAVSKPFEGANPVRILEVHKGLFPYSLTNKFVDQYYIAFKNSELVLTPGSTYTYAEFYPYLKYASMNFENWKRYLNGGSGMRTLLPAQGVQMKNQTQSLLTYIQPLGYPDNPQGAVIVTINNHEVQKLLEGLDLSEGGFAYIVDQQGNIMSSVASGSEIAPINKSRLIGLRGGMTERIHSVDMMITYTTSSYNGWTFLVAQPTHVVMSKLHYIRKITFTLTFVFVALGLLVAFAIAYRNSRPLRHIVESLHMRTEGGGESGADVYRIIRESISRLVDSNDEMRDQIKRQEPLLQAAFFEGLLKGDYLSSQEILTRMRHIGVVMDGTHAIAGIVYFSGNEEVVDRSALEELDVIRIMVKDVMVALLPEAFLIDVAGDKIAFMLSLELTEDSEKYGEIKQCLERVVDEARSRLLIPISAAIGGMYDGLSNVSRSYEEARKVLEYMNWEKRSGFMSFGDMPKASNSFDYPPDLEVRLMNMTKAGEWEVVRELLEELHMINFKQKHLSLDMLVLLMNEMWGTLVKLMHQISMEEEFEFEPVGSARSHEKLNDSYGKLKDKYKMLCDYVKERKKSQNVQLLDRVTRLLQNNFMDSDMCLDVAAESVNISKGYLSQFFKEQTGINFSEYLENLRMEKAKELLANTDLAVQDIATHVGYNSSGSFGRAFKRINGISTSVYRSVERG